jgi:hypothetical protein
MWFTHVVPARGSQARKKKPIIAEKLALDLPHEAARHAAT